MINQPDKQDEVLPFDKLLIARARRWSKQYDDNNQPRLRETVTMEKRYRADYFGFFHSNQKTVEWIGMLGKGLVTYPVIMRAVRAKLAQSLNTNIKLQIEAARREPELEAAAELAQNLFDYLQRELWTEQLEATIGHLPQIARCCFLRTRYDRDGGTSYQTPITEPREVKTADDEFTCQNCGWSDYGESLAEHSYDVQSGCPECGGELIQVASAETQEINALTGEMQDNQTGELRLEVESPLLMRVDEFNAIGFNLPKAHWINFHPLVPVYEIHHEFPHLKDKISGGGVNRWSDSARWFYELSKHSGNGSNQNAYSGASGLDELIEVNHWWIQPIACHGWQSPDLFELKNKSGQVYFDIQPGETIEAAFTRRDGYFAGLCVTIADDELLTVSNQNFNTEWSAVGWFINPHSFFPEGEERLLKLQDAATNIFTLVYDHIKRCSNPKLIYNPMFFDEKRLRSSQPGDMIAVDQQISREEAAGLDKSIFYLSPAQLSPDAYNFINIIQSIIKEESGVYDETTGAGNPYNKTATGQQLAVDRSLGLLLPPMKAKKQAKIEWAYLALELFQQNMPDAAYKSVRGVFDDEWKQSDIAAFRNINLRKELSITALEGSDIPRTQPEMQEKYVMALQLGLFDPASPLPLEIRAKILNDVLGVDIDLDNFEADRRLAAERLKYLEQIVNKSLEINQEALQNDVDGALTGEVLAQINQAAQSDPHTQIRLLSDNHPVYIQFYSDRIKGLIAVAEPETLLIHTLEAQITAHLTAETQKAGTLQALQGLAQTAGQAATEGGERILSPERFEEQEAAIAAKSAK